MASPTVAPLTFQRVPNLPRNCTFDPHDWQVLSRYWHPVAFASQIGDKPFSTKLLDEKHRSARQRPSERVEERV